MTSRLRENLSRRVLQIRGTLGMAWSRRESYELLDRLTYAHLEEGINDLDLRVCVRLYNRELIGRRKANDGN